MTIAYGKDADAEQELTARLAELARAFIADLNAQGRLVESGGADTLRRLQEHNRTHHPEAEAEAEAGCGEAEAAGIAAHPAPGAPVVWEAVTAPRAGEDTTGPPRALRPLHILGVSEPACASADLLDSCEAPAGTPAPAEQAPVQQVLAESPAVERAAVEQGPAGRAAVEQAPVQQVLAESAAVEWAPAESAPAGQTAVERVPAESVLAERAAVEQVLAGQAFAGRAAVLGPVAGQGSGVPQPCAAGGEEVRSRAAVVAARLRAEHAGRLEVTQITSDHEGVSVHIHALSLGDWEYWLTAVGAPVDAQVRPSGWAQRATGCLEGVQVHLIAQAVPRLLQEAVQRAVDPFCLGGRVYDLALAHTDRMGQTWHYQGRSSEDDIPLFTLAGTSGPPYPLTSIVRANGPLSVAESFSDS